VLFEERLGDGRWVGHATDHTLVAALSDVDAPVANGIGRVLVESVDSSSPERVVGRILALAPAPSRLATAPRVFDGP
jgi:hypothetical protein